MPSIRLRVLFFFAVLVSVFALLAGSRWGLFAKAPINGVLERLARDRGYVLSDDRSGLRAVIDGVAIDVVVRVVPSHGGPITVCTVCAKTREGALGRISLQPKHEDAPVVMRIGHVDLDTCFRIDTTSRDLAYALFDEESRRALLAFGPRGELSYVDGEVTFQWDLLTLITKADVDAAIAIVHAICRPRQSLVPYRGG